MTTCTYGGKEYSEGSEVCQAGRVMVCRGGNWGDTGRDCSGSASVDLPRKDETPEIKAIKPLEHATAGTFTNYSLQRDVYWSGDKLYGRWSTQMSSACASMGEHGYINAVQIVSGPESVGQCSGQALIRVTNTA